MCENRGTAGGHGDPKNLLEEKACEKKMVVLMSVTNNQVGFYIKPSRQAQRVGKHFMLKMKKRQSSLKKTLWLWL